MMQSSHPNRGTFAESARRTKHRVSLACLPCRSRHIRCNAAKPTCSRCTSDGMPCIYTSSRRHGNHRRKADTEATYRESRHQAILDSPIPDLGLSVNYASLGNEARMGVTCGSPFHAPAPERPEDIGSAAYSTDQPALDEDLIGLYYTYFHAAHPCVLPRWALQQYYRSDPVQFMPIVLVVQYIGSLFDLSINSEPYLEAARQSLPLSPCPGTFQRPHEIQAMLLYSIAVYWCDEIIEGIDTLGKVVKDALDLGMHLESFAISHGCNSSVLEESWRRTWWQIYVTEGNIAGSTRK